MRSSSPDGQQSNLFGPEAVLANPSASPAKGPEQTTPDTSGLRCAASLASVALQLSLESKLQAALDVNGSPEYALTWKNWDMPSGPPICALRARAHRISASVSTGERSGWPTPNAGPQNDTDTKWQARRKVCKAKHGNNGFGLTLGMAATLSGWPTPTAKFKAGGEYADPAKAIARAKGPHANDLRDFAQMAGWPTPTTRYHKDGSYCPNVESNALLGRVVWTAGPLPTGLNASTEKPVAYRLNPNFSRWLMGFPAEWANSVPTAMPSSRKSRRSS